MSVPRLNLSRLPNSSTGPTYGGASGGTSGSASGGGRNHHSRGAVIVAPAAVAVAAAPATTHPEPTLSRHRKTSSTSGTVATPRPPASSGETPMTSPRQIIYGSSANSPTNLYGPPSLARRAAELVGVLDFNVTQCVDVHTLQRKLVETAERLVRAERWYEEQVRERSSYYHHRLAHLSKYITEAEMASAPRNIAYASSANRSTSLYSRPASGSGPTSGGGATAAAPAAGAGPAGTAAAAGECEERQALTGSISRGPTAGVTAIASRQPPYIPAKQPAPVTASHVGSNSGRNLAATTGAISTSSTTNNNSSAGGTLAAERTANAKTFTAMIQSILTRDRGDLQGERDRRRRPSNSAHGGGTPTKGGGGTPLSDRSLSRGGSASQKTKRTGSKPQRRRRLGGAGSNGSSATSTPTRQRLVGGGQRRGSLGSATSGGSLNNAAELAAGGASARRKGHTPSRTRATGRRSPAGSDSGDTAARGADYTTNNSHTTSSNGNSDLYFTAKRRGLGAGGSVSRGTSSTTAAAAPSAGAAPHDVPGLNEVKRGSDMRPQPPSHGSGGNLMLSRGGNFSATTRRSAAGAGGEGEEDRSTTPLKKRSKSRSQMGGGGATTTTTTVSPSPRLANGAATQSSSSASVANSNAIVKNILKNVESHVRVMSHLENISISSSYTALRLRKPKNRRAEGDGDDEWSTPFAVSRVHKGVVPSSAPSPSSIPPLAGDSGAAGGNNGSTFAFYSDVVAPCVSNCCAGQSYLFLFTGPQESGRSQTLYGCPSKQGRHPQLSQDPRLHPDAGGDGNERGVVELAAIDFLERVCARQRQRMQCEDGEGLGAAASAAQTQESEKENRGYSAASSAAGGGSGGGLVVTFSAFTTRGEQIMDTVTKKEVCMATFPPPLGTVALPSMHLLDESSIESFSFSSSSSKSHKGGNDRDGNVKPILPEKKYIDTSCIVQFQVYACVDGGNGGGNSTLNNGTSTPGAGLGKRTMATFTFVDVAAFRAPLCKEVTCLVDTVRKVAGLGSGGEDAASSSASASSLPASSPQVAKVPVEGEGGDFFKSTRLTQLLEPALTGYVTLVSVATISGRDDLYDGACTALSFSQDIKRIHQVFFLLHIFTPRWLFETGCALENLREERERIMKSNYARGVYDYYTTASKWLVNNVSDVEGQLEKLLVETEAIRTEVEREVQQQECGLQEGIDREEATVKQGGEEARRVLQQSSSQFESVKRLDEEIAKVEQKISHTDLKTSQRVGEMRIEISALDAKKSSREKEVTQLARERSLFEGKCEELVPVLRKYAEDLAFSQVTYSSSHELQAIRRKRARLEDDLQVASMIAHKTTDSLRSDRERRSLVARLATVQQRVQSLRNTVSNHTSGRGGGSLAEALAGYLDADEEGDGMEADVSLSASVAAGRAAKRAHTAQSR